MLTAALIGNPNVGKTTLFNYLTGSNQYVGNFAGVTVDKAEGILNNSVKVVDLPGIYAMDTFSNEEKVAKNFLENEKVDVIINIADAANLDRNLYLTMQLKAFKKPIILVLNMVDVAKKKGISIDERKLSKELNVTVIPIVAAKGANIKEVEDTLMKGNFLTGNIDNDYQCHDLDEKEVYKNIETILSKCITKTNESKTDTEKIDKYILNKILAYPIFGIIIFLIFMFTFSWVGKPLQGLLDEILTKGILPLFRKLLLGTSPWFSSLLVDGIITGVGSVVEFLPIILSLFFCISILEDSGYMARAAFLMDNIMRKLGLSGKAFIPLVMGFGCSVPAIMSARTLESEKDRKLAVLLVPFMSCNAKLPVYALLVAAFFPKHQGLVVGSLYVFGMLAAVLIGVIFKNTLFKGEEEPLIIELPEYQLPNPKNLLMHTWDKGKSFLKKAGTIIFSISVIVWLLSNFSINGMTSIDKSFLAQVGRFISPIFMPLGIGTWQNSVALLSGLAAKEVVVSTLGVLYKSALISVLPGLFTSLTAYVFLVFVLLYPPCISALATIKKEYGWKMMSFSIAFQLSFAWIISFTVYRIGLLLISN